MCPGCFERMGSDWEYHATSEAPCLSLKAAHIIFGCLDVYNKMIPYLRFPGRKNASHPYLGSEHRRQGELAWTSNSLSKKNRRL